MIPPGPGARAPAHLVPSRALLEKLSTANIAVLQDFPLAFNIDFQALPPAEIQRQFKEFLWRVAAQPAVIAIAHHNEAEIKDNNLAEKQTVKALVAALLEQTRALAPHLVRIGVSGGQGTAVFPADEAYAAGDQIADVHAYLGHA